MSPSDGPKKILGAENVNWSGYLSLRGNHTILNILIVKDFCHATVDITVAEWSLRAEDMRAIRAKLATALTPETLPLVQPHLTREQSSTTDHHQERSGASE